MAENLEHLAALEGAVTALLAASDGAALGAVTRPHPVFGPLDLYQWVLFVGGHEWRHADQIRVAGEALGAGAA